MTRFLWLGLAALVLVGAAGLGLYWGLAGGAKPDLGDPALVAQGEALYRQHCAACHGADLEGQPNWREKLPDGGLPAPPHDETGHTWHHPDAVLFQMTRQGGQALAPPGFKSNMPGFGDRLTDRQIWAVLAYIKSHWPPPVRRRQEQISAAAEQ
jgi:mono/diheme cytochrome c family protein